VSRRVLIVEDEPILRKHLARALARAGFTVETAATRAEAAAHLQRTAYDALLLDVKLPDGDGLELLASLDAAHRPPHTVVMTAYSSSDNDARAAHLQIEPLLRKPVDVPEVVQRMSDVRRG